MALGIKNMFGAIGITQNTFTWKVSSIPKSLKTADGKEIQEQNERQQH